MKITKEYNRYKKCLENLERTGRNEELSRKVKAFIDEGKGFKITQIRRVDYNRVINRDRRFWQDLGFKEINIKSTKNSKRANKLINITRKKNGTVYYNCFSKRKLAFLIPTIEWVLVKQHNEKGYIEQTTCYTIIIL